MLALLITYKYAVLVPFTMIDGMLAALLCGILVALGYINPFIAYTLLVTFNIIPDVIYYALGRFGIKSAIVRRLFSRTTIFNESVKIMDRLWKKQGFLTMLNIKLAYGLSVPFIISAGAVKMRFSVFVLYSLLTSMFICVVLIVFGYAIGSSYALLEGFNRYRNLVFAAMTLIACGILFLSARHFRSYPEEASHTTS